jgi:hypothetical protein
MHIKMQNIENIVEFSVYIISFCESRGGHSVKEA